MNLFTDKSSPYYQLIKEERKLQWFKDQKIPSYLLELYRDDQLLLDALNNFTEKRRKKISTAIKDLYDKKKKILESIIKLQIVTTKLTLQEIAKKVAYQETINIEGDDENEILCIKTKYPILLKTILSHIFADRYEKIEHDLQKINSSEKINYYDCDQKRFVKSQYNKHQYINENYRFITNDLIYGKYLTLILENDNLKPLKIGSKILASELVGTYNSDIKIPLPPLSLNKNHTQISAGVRSQVWRKFFEKGPLDCSLYGKCFFCDISIDYNNWHACHTHVGNSSIDNLLPGCASCNISMNKQNIDDYIRNKGIFSSQAAKYLGISSSSQ